MTDRSAGARGAALFATPLAGGVLGAVLGEAVAADSVPSRALSTLMLPLALFSGLSLWLGAALALGALRLLMGLVMRRPRARPVEPRASFVPPGSSLLLVTSLAYSGATALVVSLLSGQATLVPTAVSYLAAGAVHGASAWWLARLGFLQPPEEG